MLDIAEDGTLVRQYRCVKIRPGGLPTTVRVPVELFERLMMVTGSARATRKVIRHTAEKAPPTVNNRSGWTTDQLNLLLLEQRIERAPVEPKVPKSQMRLDTV